MELSAHTAGYLPAAAQVGAQPLPTKVAADRRDVRLQLLPPGHHLYGKPAPEILADRWFNSAPLTLDELRGRVVLLAIKGEVDRPGAHRWDAVVRAATRYADEELSVVGLLESGDGPVSEDTVSSYLEFYGLTFPVALDAPCERLEGLLRREQWWGDGATRSLYATPGFFPDGLFVIDRNGVLRHAVSPDNLDEWVQRLLAE